MKNITVVYVANNGEFLSFHVQHANTDELQKAFDGSDIYALEYILENYQSVGVNEFKVYANQSDLADFIKKWNLNY